MANLKMKDPVSAAKHGEHILDMLTIQCPACKSKQVLTKKMTQTRWCRRCGKEWKI